MKTALLIIIIALGVMTLLSLSFTKPKIKQLDSEEFEKLINKEEVFVLQAHVPYNGEIEGTDLIMKDWENPESYIEELPENKKQSIAIYCRSGRMSQITAEQLIEIGYENIYNLEGGMNAWKESGKDLINNQK